MSTESLKVKTTLCVLWSHAVLLLVASTRFTVLTWMRSAQPLTWEYLRYSHVSGWGHIYQSQYSAAVVMVYVVAYLLGCVGFWMARTFSFAPLSVVGEVLSVLGAISFLIEGSPWLRAHQTSWILAFPAANLMLACVVIVQLYSTSRRNAGHAAA